MKKYIKLYENHNDFEENYSKEFPNISFDKNHVHYNHPYTIKSNTNINIYNKNVDNDISITNDYKKIIKLKSIKGNTINWNQICAYSKDTEINSNRYHIAIQDLSDFIKDSNTIPVNHKIYISCYAKFSDDFSYSEQTPRLTISAPGGNLYGGSLMLTIIKDNEWHYNSGIAPSSRAENKYISLVAGIPNTIPNIDTGTLYVKSINLIDLTDMYGEGNEPTLAQFNNIFKLNYYNAQISTKLNFIGTSFNVKLVNCKWKNLSENITANHSNVGIKTTCVKGDYRVSGTATQNARYAMVTIKYYITNTAGHKYYLGVSPIDDNTTFNTTDITCYRYTTKYNNMGTFPILYTAVAEDQYICLGLNTTANTVYERNFHFDLFDLTEMFGSGNEPTVSEFIKILEYLNYPKYENEFIKINEQKIDLNITELTSNGVKIFPNGMKSSGNTRDQIINMGKEWKAIKHINNNDEILETPIEYMIDKKYYKLLNKKLYVTEYSFEEITPGDRETPISAPPIIDYDYCDIPTK